MSDPIMEDIRAGKGLRPFPKFGREDSTPCGIAYERPMSFFGFEREDSDSAQEVMTDYQFKTILKMVLDILENSGSIDDAKEKVAKLIDDEK